MKLPFFDKQNTDSETSKVDYLEDCYKQADTVRKQYEPTWALNAAFLEGNQWQDIVNPDLRRHKLVEVPNPNGKIKLTSNQVLPLQRQAVAAIIENISDQVALAQTDEEADEFAAEVATDFLQYKTLDDNEAERRFQEINGCMVFGRMYRKVTWNPNNESTLGSGKVVRIGDIDNVTLDPSEVLQCPFDKGSTEPTWLIECTIKDVDEVNKLFPGKDVQPEEVQSSFFAGSRSTINIGQDVSPKPRNACLLKQMYVRPSNDAAKGKYYVWASGKLLTNDTLPDGVFPFVCIDWFPIRNKQYPLALLTNLTDLQKQYNIICSQTIELNNRKMRGDIVKQGGGDVVQKIDPKTGQKTVELTAETVRWEFMKYDLDITLAEVMLAKLWNDMMQIAGVRESSLGQTPKGQTTATSMMMNKESDMAGLQMFRRRFDEAYCKVSQIKLEIAKANYKVPRLVKIVGEDSVKKVLAFMGSDLRGTKDVIPRSTPMVSEITKQSLIKENIQLGLYAPSVSPQDKLGKMTALLASGVPGIRDEVDKLCAPMTYEDLQKLCGELDAMQAQLALMQTQGALMQMGQQMGMMSGQGEQVQLDQNGEPVQQALPPPQEEQIPMQGQMAPA